MSDMLEQAIIDAESLKEAALNNYILFLEHDYHYVCCTVKETEKGVQLDKVGKLKQFLF